MHKMDALSDRSDSVPNPGEDDVSLMQRVVAQDHQAFEQLYQRYTPRLAAYLRRLLTSYDSVEDILHDVWLVVWHQAARYRATGQVSTWLFGIARHKALKAYTQAARSRALVPPPPEPQADTSDPAHHLTEQQQRQRLRLALEMLPPAQRDVVLLTYAHGYPAQTIATLHDCPLATVRYRLQQARRRLATRLAT